MYIKVMFQCKENIWKFSKPTVNVKLNERIFPFTVILNLWKQTLENKVDTYLFLPGLLAGNRVHGNCQKCTCM